MDWPDEATIDKMEAGAALDALVCKVIGLIGLAPSRDDQTACRALRWAVTKKIGIFIARAGGAPSFVVELVAGDAVDADAHHFGRDHEFRVALCRAVAKAGRRMEMQS